jgi:hypothetical protein
VGRFFFGAFCLWMGWLIERPAEPKAIFLLTGMAVSLWLAYDVIKPIRARWGQDANANRALREQQKRASQEDKQKKQRDKAVAREWKRDSVTIPPPEAIRAVVEKYYRKKGARPLTAHHLNQILDAQEKIFASANFDQTKLTPKQIRAAIEIITSAFIEGLLAYTTEVDPRILQTSQTDSALAINIFHADLYGKYIEGQQWLKYQLAPGHYDAIKALSEPFRRNRDRLSAVFPYNSYGPNYRTPPNPDDYEDKSSYRAAENRYDQGRDEIDDIYDDYDFACLATPYWKHGSSTIPSDSHREPFEIPPAIRFAGTWIVAPPGRGKTNLLHNLIAKDRHRGTIVLMDSKGDLINGYRGLGEVIIIDPATANINPLQLGSSTRSVEFLEYIFSALLETGMTSLQKTLFRSVLTLLLKIPNATLETFRQVLTTGIEPYAQYLSQCDHATEEFFMVGRPTEFNSATYKETKQQILWRLRLILSNEYLRAIFTSPTTNVPFHELLDSGKMIIIDNSKDHLGEEGAEFFGRFFIALVWMAAVSRSRLRPEQKVPVYFYIDECHTVVKRDTKVTTILDECRSQRIALILAHQRIAQINPEVIDALNNCAIRMANSDDDAESLAKRFRVDAPSLRLPVGEFACFVRDLTPQAITVNVPLFDMSQFPASVPKPPSDLPRQTRRPLRPQPRAVPNDEVEDF